MVDLTEDEATANIGEPNEPFTQEENEEHFIEALCLPWHCTARAVQQYKKQYNFVVVCADFCGDKVPI